MLDGEIYDYAERRCELELQGASFSTTDHAELLAHGVRHGGPAFLARLEGYFSAAVWEPARVLLLRPSFGTKPLYTRHGARFGICE
jgi:asparagine synthase (glutamine-hydrolysing)